MTHLLRIWITADFSVHSWETQWWFNRTNGAKAQLRPIDIRATVPQYYYSAPRPHPSDQHTLGLDGRRSPSDAAATDSPVCWTADSLCRESPPSAGARRKYGSHLSHHMPNTVCKVQQTARTYNVIHLIISIFFKSNIHYSHRLHVIVLGFMCKRDPQYLQLQPEWRNYFIDIN